MEYNEFKNILFQKAKENNLDECEIYYVDKESLNISVYEEEVDRYSLEKSKGISFRAIYKDKMGYSYTEILDDKAIDMLIKNVIQSATYIENEDEEFIYEGSNDYEEVKTYNESLEDVDPQQLIDITKDIEKEARAYSEKVVNISDCKLSYTKLQKRIANSKGVDLKQDYNQILSYVVPVVENKENKEDGVGYVVTRDINNINPKLIATQGVEEALQKVDAKTIESGKYKTIIHNAAMADLLETFSQVFYADVAQKKMSLLADKENEIIASEVVNIIDDPLMEGGVNSSSFDDEGVKTYKKEIVSKGRLNTLLYNLKTANKVNKKSTGNGFKLSYKSTVKVESSNIYIKQDDNSLNELMKCIGEGVMITSLEGLHSGANAISGDFSLAAKGFYIKDSKKAFPIEQITVAGNFFDLLKNVEKVGDDIVFPLSNVGSPSLIVKSLSIAGK